MRSGARAAPQPGFVAVFDRLTGAMAVLAGLVLAGACLLIVADVILRNAGVGRGIPGVIEAVEYGLYLATLLGAPWALRLGAHVTVEIGLEAMPPPVRRRAVGLVDVIGLVVCLAVAWGGFVAASRAYAAGRFVFKTFTFPEWWLLAPLPAAFVLLAAEFALRLFGWRRRQSAGEPARASETL
jgi:TRAP-type C4-dicarboxylate transport system permease small subunit